MQHIMRRDCLLVWVRKENGVTHDRLCSEISIKFQNFNKKNIEKEMTAKNYNVETMRAFMELCNGQLFKSTSFYRVIDIDIET